MRYHVIEGSKTRHCCFEYSVVDSHEHRRALPVCECFDKQDAMRIAAALNGDASDHGRDRAATRGAAR